MRRSDFEHVIAAAAEHLGEDEFVVIGSQSIHASSVEPPGDLLESMEVDLYPRGEPERAVEVEVVMGDGSYFHSTFGYYAHAVGPETAKAPGGWENRLIQIIVPPRKGSNRAPTAYCLEPHDLVLAKLARGDERDWSYAKAALRSGLVHLSVLLTRLDTSPVSDPYREDIRASLREIADAPHGAG